MNKKFLEGVNVPLVPYLNLAPKPHCDQANPSKKLRVLTRKSWTQYFSCDRIVYFQLMNLDPINSYLNFPPNIDALAFFENLHTEPMIVTMKILVDCHERPIWVDKKEHSSVNK